MKRPSPLVIWLCLCAYFWAALGLAEAAQLEAVVARHAAQAITIDASVAHELQVHHLGHHDSHEPHTGVCAHAAQDCVGESDHVIKLGDDDSLSGPLVKSVAAAKLTALAACAGALAFAQAPRTVALSSAFVPSSRNSSTASVKLARLRI